jgi:hypothetical protein
MTIAQRPGLRSRAICLGVERNDDGGGVELLAASVAAALL